MKSLILYLFFIALCVYGWYLANADNDITLSTFCGVVIGVNIGLAWAEFFTSKEK